MVLFIKIHADDIQINSINYRTFSDGTAMVLPNHYEESSGDIVSIGLNNGYDGEVVIPEIITNNGVDYTVTKAYEGTFSNSTRMTRITLPSTLINLGSTPFTSCNKLTEIIVSDGNPAYSSENGILYNNDKTILIAYPGGKAGSFEVPSSVTQIADGAFYGCSKLTSIHLPSTVQHLGKCAFRACLLLTEVNIPDGITRMEDGVLRGCSSLKQIVVPESVTSIGDYAFYYCQSLTSIQIKGPVTSIGSYALGSCVKLPSVELPSTLLTMGDRVFDGSSKLSTIDIPASLQSMGIANFRGCTELQSITVSPGSNYFCSEDGVLFDKNKERLICCPSLKQKVYELPSTVKKIDSYAFFTCRYLSDIKLPLSLIEIGTSAFANCSSLTKLKLPNSLRRIGKSAFVTCTALQRIISYAMTPPVNTTDVFSTRSYDLPLFVPSSAIESYKNSEEWNRFTNIYPIEEMAYGYVSKAFRGAVSSIEVDLNNAQTNVSSYTLTLELPEGISLLKNGEGSPVYQFTNRHSSSGTMLTVDGSQEDGYTITVENGSNQVTGNEGDVLSLCFIVDEELDADTYTGTITSGTITYADGVTGNIDSSSFDIKVEEGKMGDVNLSGDVTVTDVTLTINRILGEPIGTYYWQLSDINKDGTITISDVTGLVNIILGQE